jgi:hypothetical protein
MPMFNVIGPDGSSELWVVAAANHQALDIVKRTVPANCTAVLSATRLPIGEDLQGMKYGEARKVSSVTQTCAPRLSQARPLTIVA